MRHSASLPGSRKNHLGRELPPMLQGLSSKFQTFFQGPAKAPKAPQPPPSSAEPALQPTLQERFTQTRSAEELEGSGFTSVSEEFLRTRPNPAWVAQQKSALQPGQQFHEPISHTERVGAEVHTNTGYVLKEMRDGASWMSKVTVQGPGQNSEKVLQGALDLTKLASEHSMTFMTQGAGDNPRLARDMTFSPEGVTVRELDSLGRTPASLYLSPDRTVTLEKNLGLGPENPQSMGRLQADGSIAFDGNLSHLCVPKTLAIEFPLPLDLTSNMKSS